MLNYFRFCCCCCFFVVFVFVLLLSINLYGFQIVFKLCSCICSMYYRKLGAFVVGVVVCVYISVCVFVACIQCLGVCVWFVLFIFEKLYNILFRLSLLQYVAHSSRINDSVFWFYFFLQNVLFVFLSFCFFSSFFVTSI